VALLLFDPAAKSVRTDAVYSSCRFVEHENHERRRFSLLTRWTTLQAKTVVTLQICSVLSLSHAAPYGRVFFNGVFWWIEISSERPSRPSTRSHANRYTIRSLSNNVLLFVVQHLYRLKKRQRCSRRLRKAVFFSVEVGPTALECCRRSRSDPVRFGSRAIIVTYCVLVSGLGASLLPYLRVRRDKKKMEPEKSSHVDSRQVSC